MIIGVPKEIKKDENRISVIPGAVSSLVQAGHRVLIQQEAGLGSSISDEAFRAAGGEIVPSLEDVYGQADLIYKVKEPQLEEYDLLREGQILFAFLHLAAEPEVTKVLIRKKVAAFAYETIQINGSIPILAPMSEVAGRMATQVGSHFLEKAYGGKGIMLGGVPGVAPAEVTVIGGGIVGVNAAKIAVGMGARVTILDIDTQRLRYLDDLFRGRVLTLASNPYNFALAVARTDLLIGAVLIPGARTPKLCTEEMIKSMAPGSVIVDVAVDQGGCVETIDRTSCHSNPTYEKYGVLHYAVPNMPGAVPLTSTYALSNVTLPYALELAQKGYMRVIEEKSPLSRGLNVFEGKVTHQAVAEALELPFVPACD
ncbi:MAG: alanine dehydrogenase [Bacillota bacterium]|nr:alanine dehydrogenase [Bacillota bacterium]